MTTEAEIGSIVGVTFLVLSTTIGAYISLIRGQGALSERVAKLEILFETFGRKAARTIHSPHDPYGIDPLLDKYLDRNYELSMEEWKQLYTRTTEIAANPETPKELIFPAEMLAAICMHKLFIPPPKRLKS